MDNLWDTPYGPQGDTSSWLDAMGMRPNQDGPTGIPDPNNPGFDTGGYPLPAGRTQPPTATVPPAGNVPVNGAPNTTTPPPSTDPAPSPDPQPNPAGGALANFSEPAPAFPQMAPFSFADFKPPSIDEAMNDPYYQWELGQGRDQLQNWAAARGTLNDSETAKNLMDYGRNAGTQRLNDVWQRDYGIWDANRNNAQSAYGLNRQTQSIDPWTAQYNPWVQRGNWYLQNQGTVANAALAFASL